MCEVKTKALISCAISVHLICVFVFAYAKGRFSHNEAHIQMLSCLPVVDIQVPVFLLAHWVQTVSLQLSNG